MYTRKTRQFIDEKENSIIVKDIRFYEDEFNIDQPSVTTILQCYPKDERYENWLIKYGDDCPKIAGDAAKQGTVVHQLIEQFLSLSDGSTISYDSFLYTAYEWELFHRFLNFYDTYQPTDIISEVSLSSSIYGYGGTLDLICTINGHRYLIDFKTGKNIHHVNYLQVVAYAKLYTLITKEGIDNVGILWLQALTHGPSKKGIQGKNWQLKIIDGQESYNEIWETFLHTQAIYKIEFKNLKPIDKRLKFTVIKNKY